MQAQDFDPRVVAPVEDGLTEYEVTTHTADVQDAATDADVFLVLYGATGIHYLRCSLPCVTRQLKTYL